MSQRGAQHQRVVAAIAMTVPAGIAVAVYVVKRHYGEATIPLAGFVLAGVEARLPDNSCIVNAQLLLRGRGAARAVFPLARTCRLSTPVSDA